MRGGDGFKPGFNALIAGNYVTELGWNAPTAHADGVQINGGSNVRIIGYDTRSGATTSSTLNPEGTWIAFSPVTNL